MSLEARPDGASRAQHESCAGLPCHIQDKKGGVSAASTHSFREDINTCCLLVDYHYVNRHTAPILVLAGIQ